MVQKNHTMKTITKPNTDLTMSEIALGCMRISEMEPQAIDALIQTALDSGINFFDHADIYGGGKSESKFAEAVAIGGTPRDKMLLQTKVGIRKGMFDFSKEHILNAVDGCLKRLRTEYVDVLLLHRPDALVEPAEVAEAFNVLESSGKVRHFGVSNQNPMQIELLKTAVKQPLLFNQLQFSVTNTGMVDQGINVNTMYDGATDRDGSVLDYCRLHDITIQPWSPFQYGFFEGVFLGNEKFPELNAQIDQLAEKYAVTNSAIAIAWILRHPAHMQPILGTTNQKRVAAIAKASDICLTREEWYAIYLAAGNKLP